MIKSIKIIYLEAKIKTIPTAIKSIIDRIFTNIPENI